MTILVVDDHEPNLYLLQALLGGRGHTVVTAANGAEALTKARQSPPGLIITDILMPVMDGFLLCREWKRDERLRDIPLVFYTASYTEEQDRNLALSLGAASFIVKPAEPDCFLQTIETVLAQRMHGAVAAPPESIQDEAVYLKEYNTSLIHKLEDKMAKLEQANRELERDLTERKQAEIRIREQAALLDITSDAIYVTALDGAIQFWNKGAEQTYGWPAAEVLGRKVTELLSVPGSETVDLLAAVLKKGDWSGERRHKTKAGREVVVFARLTLVPNAAGQPASIFTIDTDITEKKQLEARFLQAQRLESLGALASGIAHDLNNVLAPVLLATALLQQKMQTEADRKMLATMEASARRGADIVRQVLTFARGIEGKRIPLQLQHIVREIEAIARETFPKNIELVSDAAKDLWPVLGDTTQLHQVLMNLCVNARDAMPGGGRLTVAAANFVLDEAFALMTAGAKAGPHVRLSISDTGTGIPPELFDKIFDPFFTTKAPGKGTGLGLSTVLGIVRSHGGFIQFKSVVGKGTSFEIYLPAVLDAKPAARPGPRPPPPRGQGELILLVDDEIAIRTVATTVLEASGYRVLAASEGTEALSVFMQNRAAVAAIITDMMMPGMDGPTLVRVVRRIDPQVRIIGISGVGEGTVADVMGSPALSAGLTKPFTGESLLFVLHAVLKAPPGTQVRHSASPWRGASAVPWVPSPSENTS